MLDGLDDIDWAHLDHAYGPAHDLPELLRQAASGGDPADDAVCGFFDTIFHQGTVYPATVAAVPFLVELAGSAPARRDEFGWMLGMLADPRHANGDALEAVRGAVSARAEALMPLLADADERVRAAAAYALTQCEASASPLWSRWAAEDAPDVRASLLLALASRDPRGSAAVVADAAVYAEPVVRAAAALALHRTRASWPDGAVATVAAAFDAGATVEYCWHRREYWIYELLHDGDDDLVVAALLAKLLESASPDTRRSAVWAMIGRVQSRRSAPARVLPLLRAPLDDPDDGVRDAVINVLRRSGPAVGRYADEVARLAARYPDTDDPHPNTPQRQALETLLRLDDPRWVELTCAAASAGHSVSTDASDGSLGASPRVMEAVRRRLAELADREPPHPAVAVLASALLGWGRAAAAAAPELLAVLPHAPRDVTRALTRLGRPAPETLPQLRELANQQGDVEAAVAVWRLTGDAEVLIDTLSYFLARDRGGLPWNVHVAAEAGGALAPLVPTALARLTGAAASTDPELRVLAARLVWAATGDPGPGLPAVRAVVADGSWPAKAAAELVADLAAAGAADLSGFVSALRAALDDTRVTVEAAGALWRLGTPPDDLVPALVVAIEDGRRAEPAVSLLVEMNAVRALPELERLAEHDERIAGIDERDIAWRDEALREDLRAAVAALRPRPS